MRLGDVNTGERIRLWMHDSRHHFYAHGVVLAGTRTQRRKVKLDHERTSRMIPLSQWVDIESEIIYPSCNN